jgi:hypothetical protein
MSSNAKGRTKSTPAKNGGAWLRPSRRLALYHRDGFCCSFCGRAAEEGNPLSIDHVLAAELGGTNDDANLITACRRCNSRKQDKSMRAWFALLRAEGVDTTLIARRIRNATRRPLDRTEGLRLLALRSVAA